MKAMAEPIILSVLFLCFSFVSIRALPSLVFWFFSLGFAPVLFSGSVFFPPGSVFFI
jgi:hypothetical protein